MIKYRLRIVVILVILSMIVGFLGAMATKTIITMNIGTGELETYTQTSKVSCKSNSMGLTLDCNDKTYLSMVGEDDDIELGGIYTYREDENTSVIHRVVICLENCSRVVFKGDANKFGEIVNRSQIKYKLEMVEYR